MRQARAIKRARVERLQYLPTWVCETHLREIDDLETSGEISEGKIRLSEIVNEYLWCADCTQLKGGK